MAGSLGSVLSLSEGVSELSGGVSFGVASAGLRFLNLFSGTLFSSFALVFLQGFITFLF